MYIKVIQKFLFDCLRGHVTTDKTFSEISPFQTFPIPKLFLNFSTFALIFLGFFETLPNNLKLFPKKI